MKALTKTPALRWVWALSGGALIATMAALFGAPAYAAEKTAMSGPPAKVEIVIKDREHGYETQGFTTPAQETIVVVRNEDSVTHGFASALFKDIPVQVEGGTEVKGKNFRSFHVEPGHTMTLRFSTAPSRFDPGTGGAESLHHALWCDIHPQVKGEVLVVETHGEIGGG
jgi:hypothetical protein